MLNEDGSIEKTSTRNDAFYFSYSPLMCYQPIFGYELEKLDKKNIKFYSKKYLENGKRLYFSNLREHKKNLTFYNPACFLFPNENNCRPGDVFSKDDHKKLIKFLQYKKFNFKQNKIQIISNYISIVSILFSVIVLIYFLFNYLNILRKKN